MIDKKFFEHILEREFGDIEFEYWVIRRKWYCLEHQSLQNHFVQTHSFIKFDVHKIKYIIQRKKIENV